MVIGPVKPGRHVSQSVIAVAAMTSVVLVPGGARGSGSQAGLGWCTALRGPKVVVGGGVGEAHMLAG